MDWTPKGMVNALWKRGCTSAFIASKFGVALSTVLRTGRGEASGCILVEKGIRSFVRQLLKEEKGAEKKAGGHHD